MESWEMRELEMDRLREESYQWDEDQRQMVQKELEKRGLSPEEAWERMDDLNRENPNLEPEEILELLNQ